jgi:hypothetical protein
MSSVRPAANGDPHDDGPPRRPRGLRLDAVVLAALAAAVSSALLAAFGIAAQSLAVALIGVALASGLLGLAAGSALRGQAVSGVSARSPDRWFRALGSASVFIVAVFVLAIVASATDITDGGRTLVRATGWPALTVAFAALGFALAMRRTNGRRRPDWVFVSIALLLIGFCLVTLAGRLDAILLFA